MFLKAFLIAFSMYSRIPVPKTEWNEKNMRYVFCFFPLVGVVIGVVVWALGNFLMYLNYGSLFFASIMSAVPIFITGGIHFDGFLDTLDGINSYADKEKKLEILKDPNSGAFAIMGGIMYFVLSVGFWSEVNEKALDIIPFGYVLSRALSGFSVVLFPPAKKTGLVSLFKNNADKIKVCAVMAVFVTIDLAVMIYIDDAMGSFMLFTAVICFLYHYYNCMRNFGGITGDLAGYFLQICELAFLAVNVIL